MNLKRKMFRVRLQNLNKYHKLEICFNCGKKTMARTRLAERFKSDSQISTACLNCSHWEIGPNPSKIS